MKLLGWILDEIFSSVPSVSIALEKTGLLLIDTGLNILFFKENSCYSCFPVISHLDFI